jgi:hypothetical protein
MGEIFLARQTGVAGFQREVVLKLLHRKLGEHPKAVEMFLDEARLAASLCHSNIVQIFDVGEEDGAYFIVMERVQGASLRALAETTSRLGQMIPMELSVNIIIQILEGLRYAHSYRDETGRPLKIVHRDICPSNVLVTYDGVVKIVDFGIARAENQLRSESGLRPGKFAYMSPEMVLGQPVDARADLFGVGILLYELTVGQRLIRAGSFEALARVVNDPISPPTFARAGYPVDLEILVMRALERDPADRFGSAEEMLEELEQFAYSTGLRVSRIRLGRLVAKTMGRHLGALALDAAAPGEESAADAAADELDFDRAVFDGSSPVADAADAAETITSVREERDEAPAAIAAAGAERVRRVMEAVQQANEAIAELVAASGLEEEEGEEGKTVEMRAADQAALRADTVEPEEPALTARPVPDPITQVVSAEQIEAEEPMRDGSALVVTDELVEEEEDLDPGDDLLREPQGRGPAPELVVSVPARPAATAASPAPPPPPRPTPAAPSPPAPPPPPGAASADLLEALADISAELKAAEESDRRREEALSAAIEQLGDNTVVPTPPAPEPATRSEALTPAAAPLVAPVSAPPPVPAVPRRDELEATDGDARAPDELELSDLASRPSAPVAEPELEADGETIVLQPEASAVELVLDGVGAPAPVPEAAAAAPGELAVTEEHLPPTAELPVERPADRSEAEAPDSHAEEGPKDAAADAPDEDDGLEGPTLSDGPSLEPGARAEPAEPPPSTDAAPRKKPAKRRRRRRR